jgi:hypothetical protein
MGSTSAGAQGPGFGVSVGSTWTDKGCDRRYNAQTLVQLGAAKAALALMCQDESVRAAMATAGTPCSGTPVAEATMDPIVVTPKVVVMEPPRQPETQPVAVFKPVTTAATNDYQGTDPIVRKRLGLPPAQQ